MDKEDHLSGGTERRKPEGQPDPELFAEGCAQKTELLKHKRALQKLNPLGYLCRKLSQ